jgi:hypothetical protein
MVVEVNAPTNELPADHAIFAESKTTELPKRYLQKSEADVPSIFLILSQFSGQLPDKDKR